MKTYTALNFVDDLVKIMPGYFWEVQAKKAGYFEATGKQYAGSNRSSSFFICRNECEEFLRYVATAAYGPIATLVHTLDKPTLADAFQGLQDYYEDMAAQHKSQAQAIANGRKAGGAA